MQTSARLKSEEQACEDLIPANDLLPGQQVGVEGQCGPSDLLEYQN
jgi:hypothetical protein